MTDDTVALAQPNSDKERERTNRARIFHETSKEMGMFLSNNYENKVAAEEYESFINKATDYYYKTPTRLMSFKLEQRKKILGQNN